MSIAAQLLDRVQASVADRLSVARGEIEHRVRALAPRDTGQLQDSISVDVWAQSGTRYQTTIRAAAPQASWTDEGTGVYAGRGRIYPVRARALVFYWKQGPAGPGVYAFRSVAGQRPQRWWSGPERLERAVAEGLHAAGIGA